MPRNRLRNQARLSHEVFDGGEDTTVALFGAAIPVSFYQESEAIVHPTLR